MDFLRRVKRTCERWMLNRWERRFKQAAEGTHFRNRLALRVLGLRRSGNHAVINWIVQNHDGVTCFLNNVFPERHANPFLGMGQALFKTSAGVVKLKPDDCRRVQQTLALHLEHPLKDVLIYSYEDRPLDDPYFEVLKEHHDQWLGEADRTVDILVIRDAMNCFASRKKSDFGVDDRTVELWKQYAREYLGASALLGENTVLINYNRWCCDAAYRKLLAGTIGMSSIDRGIDHVSEIGGGSSFDQTKYHGDARRMAVFDRWQQYAEDERFRRLFDDPELVELVHRVDGLTQAAAEWLQRNLGRVAGARGG